MDHFVTLGKDRLEALPPAEKEDGISGDGLEDKAEDADDDLRLFGAVGHHDVVFDEGAEGEVAEGGAEGVAEHADQDGRDGGRAEVAEGSVAHARIYGDHAYVALRI